MPAALASAGEGTEDPSSREGRFDFSLATRLFDSPLFGTTSSTVYRFQARQLLDRGADLDAWFASGFPNYVADYGVAVNDLRWGAGVVSVGAGDFPLLRTMPEGMLARDAYPLRGAVMRRDVRETTWSVFAGSPKYDTGTATGSPDWMAGGRYLTRHAALHFGGSVTAVRSSPAASPGDPARVQGILGLELFAEPFPGRHLYTVVQGTHEGGASLEAGTRLDFARGDLGLELYRFGDEFPAARPLYRPGETGVRIDGSLRPHPAWAAFGSVDYVLGSELSATTEGERLRGDVALGWTPGGRLPSVQLAYLRSRETYDSRSIARPATASDQLRLRVYRGSPSEFMAASAERVTNEADGAPDRTQLLLDYRKVIGLSAVVDGSLLAQRMDPDDMGFTVESAYERHLAGPLSWLAGLGGSRVDRAGSVRGEGVLRLGLAHRPSRRRWHARVEVRLPFSVGLERSDLASRTVALDVGTRFAWRDLEELGGIVAPWTRRGRYGTVAGRVLIEGEGLGGVPVLVDGETRAVTAGDGTFRIRRVEVGAAFVTLDMRALDPGLVVQDGFSRQVVVSSGSVSRSDFTVASMSYFQGSILVCSDRGRQPLRRARVVLRGEGYESTRDTTAVGGFLFDAIPPGRYELVVDSAAGIDPALLPWRLEVDLREDRAGEVLAIGCEAPDADGPAAP